MNDEFIALAVVCRGSLKENSRFAKSKPGAWMHRQSTDVWALRLHSCRALSSQPRAKDQSREQNAQTQEIAKTVTYVPGRKCHLCIGTFTKPCLRRGQLFTAATIV